MKPPLFPELVPLPFLTPYKHDTHPSGLYYTLLWAGTTLDSLSPASLCTLATPLSVSGVSVDLLGVALRKQQACWGGVAVTTCYSARRALRLGAAISPATLGP